MSYVAVSLMVRETNLFSVVFGLEWDRTDWFLVSLFIDAAILLSLILHLPTLE